MQYIQIENGIVIGHFSAEKIPQGVEYREVTNFTGTVGIPENQINENGEILTLQQILDTSILVPGTNETVIWDIDKYKIVPDFSKKSYWSKTTGQKINIPIGINPGSDAIDQEPPYDFVTTWDNVNGEWIIDLISLKSLLRANANQEHEQRLIRGFEYPSIGSGNTLSCKTKIQALLSGIETKLNNGVVTYPIYWRTVENGFLLLNNAAELKAMTSAIFTFVEEQLVKIWSCNDQIEAATTVSQIEAIYHSYLDDTIVVE